MIAHIRRLGVLCIVLGIVNAALALSFLTVLDRQSFLADYLPDIVTLVWLILIAGLAIPSVITGIGLMRLKHWARPVGMVLLTLNLLNVPLGTAVGIYGLWVLMTTEADDVFSPRFYKKYL